MSSSEQTLLGGDLSQSQVKSNHKVWSTCARHEMPSWRHLERRGSGTDPRSNRCQLQDSSVAGDLGVDTFG